MDATDPLSSDQRVVGTFDKSLLEVSDLSIGFGIGPRLRPVVSDVSFSLEPGETLALVGESGSGKTLTAKALMGLLPRAATVMGGTALLELPGKRPDLLALSEAKLQRLRGCTVSMIFQEPMSALSPLHTVGRQVSEVLRVHGMAGNTRAQVMEMFEEVGFPNPARAYAAYPFELSGGLRQRAVIAMAMIGQPSLVIADEPTTALDVTTQAMVLDLLKRLQRDRQMSVIMITHDLGVVANMADKVVVLRRGEVVEKGLAHDVLTAPGHGYTRALIDAAPKVPEDLCPYTVPNVAPILAVSSLSKTYPGRKRSFGPDDPPVRAVADFNMVLERGKTVAVVGESGSGKSTVAKLMLRAERPDPGAEMTFCPRDGTPCDIAALSGAEMTAFRLKAQMVFQDPYASLSPRLSVQDILTEPMLIEGRKRAEAEAKAESLDWIVG
ncbi:MAG: ABC transporter ATP-binding protein, partial [Pseudomonadota bacterium]